MSEFLYKSETYAIIGAMMEVHKVLGSGFFEIVYQESLSIEFTKRNIPFSEQPKIDIFYKGEKLSKFYVPDFICFDKIVVEIKALSELNTEHEAQLLNGLKATGLKIGILANFGETSLRYKRFIY
jgi:GxxExxY protein